ncbi:MAG: hypothetical protein AAF458_00420 [Pseudomonadota bacterium]
MRKLAGIVGAIWGLGAVVCMLGYACVRLSAVSIEAFDMSWHPWHWLVLLVNTAFMLHAEGYKGFQQGFAPRVVARARHIVNSPTALTVVLAPLFCMSFFSATRHRLLVSYGLTTMIISMVLVFEYIPQPLRGILDVGVVAGLVWGLASIGTFIARALSGRDRDVSPELPQTA